METRKNILLEEKERYKLGYNKEIILDTKTKELLDCEDVCVMCLTNKTGA